MNYYKEQEQSVTRENQQMTAELSELRLQLQKISYESKENAIHVDSLREANQDLMAELEELKKNLADMRQAHKEATDGEKEKKKAEKMAQMMSGFDPSGVLNEKERQIRNALSKLDLEKQGSLSIEELVSLRRELAESKVLLEQHSKTIEELESDKEALEKKKVELEGRFATLEQEYEELLDKTIAEEEARAQERDDLNDTVSALKVIQIFMVTNCNFESHFYSLYSFCTGHIRSSWRTSTWHARKCSKRRLMSLSENWNARSLLIKN